MYYKWDTILKNFSSPPSEDDITRFEFRIGAKLPEEYKQFLFTYNGGSVLFEHEINLPSLDFPIDVQYLDAFSASFPDAGILEVRKLEECESWGAKSWVRIGADSGTGYYYLSVDPNTYGMVAYAYKDDVPNAGNEWGQNSKAIPTWLHHVCDDFDSLGKLIEKARC